ncbi:hypothetical protein [Chitinophaga sp.]|uniref:hypothetical protein n=1 Tax=Chitinophaga sp. TaxID=1869181 RepID=UPI002F91DF8C
MKKKLSIKIHVSADFLEVMNDLYSEYNISDTINNIWLLYANLIKDKKVSKELLQDMLSFCVLQQRLITAIYLCPLPDPEALGLTRQTKKIEERAASLD